MAVAHVVVRGTYLPDSVRCEARQSMRPPTWTRLEDDSVFDLAIILCYADMRANAYLVGSGPPTMTVVLQRINYWEPEMDDADIAAEIRRVEHIFRTGERVPMVSAPAGGIEGREAVLFLGPAMDHSVEAWQAFTTWNVQRNDDESVVVRHPNAELWLDTHRSQVEIPLETFAASVLADHNARVTEYDGRIISGITTADDEDLPMLVTDANMLNDYHVAVENTTHDDGPPRQPPVPER